MRENVMTDELWDVALRIQNNRNRRPVSPYTRGTVKLRWRKPDMPPRIDAAFYKSFEIGNKTNLSNRTLDKVYDTMQQAEDLRVAWAERQQALNLVTSSLRTLLRTYSALRRRDPRIVRQVLRIKPSYSDVIKQPAGLWLAYHFGVKPTISDLHHALGIFTNALPPLEILHSTSNSFSAGPELGRVGWNEGFTFTGKRSCKMGAKVVAFDPHVQLATALGFGQPLSTAWELTPWSWAVDYFGNVGQMLKNLEPRFPGLQLEDEYVTHFLKGHLIYGHDDRPWHAPGTPERITTHSWDVVCTERSVGLPGYLLEFHKPSDLSGQQASYLAAALSQRIKSR
mgnify:CR=1 FL=1